MNRIDNSGQGIASLGRDEDQYMAHVAQGEMVVPPVISPETRQRIEQELRAAGLSPDEYTVGDGMSINPITGQPEFGWLKKKFKQVKKVAKKVAPVIGPLANFIPGVGPLLSAAIQAGTTKLAGGSWKDALKAGAFSYGAGKLGGGIGGLKGKPTGGNFFGKGGKLRNFFGKGDGIFGRNIGPSMKSGIASLFGGAGGQETGLENLGDGTYMDPITGDIFTTSQLSEMGLLDASGNLKGSALSKLSGINEGGFDFKNLFGGGNPGQSQLGLIEDFFKGKSSDAVRDGGGFGGGGMGNAGIMGISALLGKMAYDSAKDRAGGLAATPEITMDNLGRYSIAKNLGKDVSREEFGLGPAPQSLVFASMGGPIDRQYFNQGGIAAVRELDMRDGGESAGPGTGTSDDIPAMLSDGEFVMTAAATKGAGAFNLNKTKSGIELISGGKSSRKKGVENMRELMEIFEAI